MSNSTYGHWATCPDFSQGHEPITQPGELVQWLPWHARAIPPTNSPHVHMHFQTIRIHLCPASQVWGTITSEHAQHLLTAAAVAAQEWAICQQVIPQMIASTQQCIGCTKPHPETHLCLQPLYSIELAADMTKNITSRMVLHVGHVHHVDNDSQDDLNLVITL